MKMIEKTQTDVVKERVQRTESLPKEREEAHGFHLVRNLVCMITDDEKLLLGNFPKYQELERARQAGTRLKATGSREPNLIEK